MPRFILSLSISLPGRSWKTFAHPLITWTSPTSLARSTNLYVRSLKLISDIFSLTIIQLDISTDGFLSLMADNGDTKDDVKVPEGDVGEKIDKLFRVEEKDTSKHFKGKSL